MPNTQTRIADALLALKASGAVTTNTADSVIVDLGAGKVLGELVVDITAIDVASADEVYHVRLQGSASPTFASDIVDLAVLRLGSTVGVGGGVDNASVAARYLVPFTNEIVKTAGAAPINYRYVRMYTTVGGTSPSITYSSRLSKGHAN